MDHRYRPSREALLTELGDGTGVLLHLGTKFYFTLNATGVSVWKTIVAKDANGGVSVSGIAEALEKDYRIEATTAARDVAPLVQEMLAEGLIAAI